MRTIPAERHDLVVAAGLENKETADALARFGIWAVGHLGGSRRSAHQPAGTVSELVALHLAAALLDPQPPSHIPLDDRLDLGGAHALRHRAGIVQKKNVVGHLVS